MKFFILSVLFLAVFCTTFSQTERGEKFVGGQLSISEYDNNNSISFNSSNYKYSTDNYYLNFRPCYGYFVKDNFAIGADINFTVSNIKYKDEDSNNKTKSKTYGIGVFGRRYVNICDNFKFFWAGRLGYNYTREEINSSAHVNEIALNVAPGFVYFVTPHISVESQFGNLYYIHSKGVSEDYADLSTRKNSYGINLDATSLVLGLNYYF
jgi:hypothetical protein